MCADTYLIFTLVTHHDKQGSMTVRDTILNDGSNTTVNLLLDAHKCEEEWDPDPVHSHFSHPL